MKEGVQSHLYKDSFFRTVVNIFDMEISNNEPDIIVCNCGELEPGVRSLNSKLVFFTGERLSPNMDLFDYAISFDHSDHPNHIRYPLYMWDYRDYINLGGPHNFTESGIPKKFCNFLYSNGDESLEGVRYRNSFFRSLSTYKGVDSGGLVMNNMSSHVGDKIQFLSEYKFTISMENRVYSGYTTEKLIDPFKAKSVPIYHGNVNIVRDFNPKSFINAHDFSNMQDLKTYIIHLDESEKEYLDILSSTPLLSPLPSWGKMSEMLKFWEKIVLS